MSGVRSPVPIFLEMDVLRLPRKRKKRLMNAFRLLFAAVALHTWYERTGRTHEHAPRLFRRLARSARFRRLKPKEAPTP